MSVELSMALLASAVAPLSLALACQAVRSSAVAANTMLDANVIAKKAVAAILCVAAVPVVCMLPPNALVSRGLSVFCVR